MLRSDAGNERTSAATEKASPVAWLEFGYGSWPMITIFIESTGYRKAAKTFSREGQIASSAIFEKIESMRSSKG